MFIDELRIESFRNLAAAEIEAGRGVNWLYGANGAGKTSVLEAIHVLGRGRSFRTGNTASLTQDGARCFRIIAETAEPAHRLALERAGPEWTGRIDHQPCRRMSEFARALPLVLIDPENHLLVEGGPALRRSFIDWGLFHVEPCYLEVWQRYGRLLRQRNAALRQGAGRPVLDAVEHTMAAAAARVDADRAGYVKRLQRETVSLEARLAFALPPLVLAYRPSAADAEGYRQAWRGNRERDLEHGFSREGPHRADVLIRAGEHRAAPRLSRGQMKLAALLLKLAQMALTAERAADPVVLLDDPVSELDANHLERLFDWIGERSNQTWITAVERPGSIEARMFHVEQGKIRSMV